MSEDRNTLFKQQMYDEVWDEIASLKGKELDEYLTSLGLSPEDLLHSHEKALAAAKARLRGKQ